MVSPRIGTVDLPLKSTWERYFAEHSYLELSALFSAPIKASTLTRWREAMPAGAIGLVAPWPLAYGKRPASAKGWAPDPAGTFAVSPAARGHVAELARVAEVLGASAVIFPSPADQSPSASNRDRLRAFFGEVATAAVFAGRDRVWIPGGLWDPLTATVFAQELGIVAAVDPLVKDPAWLPDVYAQLPTETAYFRVGGMGRTGTLSGERLDELIELTEVYPKVTIAFATERRGADAKNLRKMLASN